ncbi:alpha/beta hydrolase [Aquihabitans sp. G128]|uniref:alpha/beta fold hydrolase n=1 Tax=Aquihabitans sp. G128 TaxID=2849779 RepID=UPI001C21C6E0|nr:alpha/beta fold hydrolase [Aquihabitans sp. G128]QXC59432.1 alpha/beta hydrolase [Aquihabitans sp. G128]
MPTASVNGIDLHYERSGEGDRLLYLNGSGATLATTGMLLTPFTNRFDVAAHDQRGLGLTSIPPGPYSMADYAADALGLLDHLGWDSCRVVGISFGGMVAQELAVTAPERVERLALLCTSPGGPELASYPLHELVGLAPEERSRIGTTILDTRFTPEWLADPAHETDRFIAEMMASRNQVSKLPEVLRGEWEQLGARQGHDVVDRLGRITCPTLVASGRYDGIAPLVNGEAIAERVPNAELRVYEGGHAFFGQDPKAIPDTIRWLAEA